MSTIPISCTKEDGSPVVGETSGETYSGTFQFSLAPSLLQVKRMNEVLRRLQDGAVVLNDWAGISYGIAMIEARCTTKPEWWASKYLTLEAVDFEPLTILVEKMQKAEAKYREELKANAIIKSAQLS